jgi:hypothetical protein
MTRPSRAAVQIATAVLASAVLAANTSAQASWERLPTGRWWDSTSIRERGDTIEVSVRGQSKAVEQKYPGTRYTIAQMRFFCSRKTMTVGPVVLYRADGQVVTTTRNDWSEEQLPPPESPAEVELNFFCSRRRGGA